MSIRPGSSRVPNIPTGRTATLAVAALLLLLAIPAGALNATYKQSGSPDLINGTASGLIASMNVSAEAAEWNLTETTRQTNFTHTFGTSTTAAGENAGFEAGTAGQWTGAGWYRQISGSATVGSNTVYSQQILGPGPSGAGAPYNGAYQYNESTDIRSSGNCAASDCLTIEVGRHYNSTSTNYPYPVNSTRTWNFSAAVRTNYGQDIGTAFANASFAAAGATFNLTLDNGSIKYLHYYVVALNGVILTNTTSDVYLYPFGTSARCPVPTTTLTPCTDTSWAYINSSNLSRDIELAFDGQPWSLNGAWLNAEYRFENIRAARTTVMNYSFDDLWLNDTSPQVQVVFNSTSAAIPGTTVNYLNVSANLSSTARGNYTLEIWNYNTNTFTECWRGLAATPYVFVNATCNIGATPADYIASNGNVTLRLNSSRNNTTETAAIDFIEYNVNFTDLWPPNWTGFSRNRTVVHKNETISFSSNWTDNFLLYGASLETNATVGGLTRNVTFNLSLFERPSGDANFTYGELANFSDVQPGVKEWRIFANDTNDTGDPPRKPNNTTGPPFNATSSFELWGWASITRWHPQANQQVSFGSSYVLDCQVTDKDNSSNLQGYGVHFYKYQNLTGYLGYATTVNTTGGNATLAWDTSAEQLGTYTPTCHLEGSNTSLYYNASETNISSTTLYIYDTQAPRWSGFEKNRTVVHKNETILFSSYWTDNFALNGSSLETNSTISQSTQNVTFNTSLALSTSTWVNYTLFGSNFTDTPTGAKGWRIFANDTNETIQGNNTTGPPFNATSSFELWGWARNTRWSPAAGLQAPWGSLVVLDCRATDNDNSSALQGYRINFYRYDNFTAAGYLGFGITNSTGNATYAWNTSLEPLGAYTPACALENVNTTLYYNASEFNGSGAALTIVDTEAPRWWTPLQNRTAVHPNETVHLSVNWTDNFDLNQTWLLTNETGPDVNSSSRDLGLLVDDLTAVGWTAAVVANAGVGLNETTRGYVRDGLNITYYYNSPVLNDEFQLRLQNIGPFNVNKFETFVFYAKPDVSNRHQAKVDLLSGGTPCGLSSAQTIGPGTDWVRMAFAVSGVGGGCDKASVDEIRIRIDDTADGTDGSGNITLDEVLLTNETLTNSSANFTWKNITAWAGTTVRWRIYANDSSDSRNNTTNQTFEVWGWANVTNRTPVASSVLVGSTVRLDCHIRNENNGSGVPGYGVNFYRYSNLTSPLGTSWANATGNATLDWDTTGVALGTYTPACQLESENTTLYYNATGPSIANSSITLVDTQAPRWTGFDRNRTVLHKNETIFFNSSWTDNLALNASSLEMNATTDQAARNVSFNMSVTTTSNTSNFTLEPSQFTNVPTGVKGWRIFMNDTSNQGNNTTGWPYASNTTFELWGWARITRWHPLSGLEASYGSTVVLDCQVTDKDNSSNLQGYGVHFYKYQNLTGSLGYATTNASGNATVTWNTAGEQLGAYTPACHLEGSNTTRYYNASEFNLSSTTLYIFDTQPPRWTGSGANRTIVHKNESISFNSTWTDNFGLNASSLETNATVAGALGNISFNMSITGTSNTSNFTLDLTPGGAYALGYKRWRIFMNDTNSTPNFNNTTTTATFLLYGWANLTNLTQVASVTQGTNVTLQCRVRDVHNDTAISGYNVTFFNNTSGVETPLGSNFTNSTGDAIYTFPTEGITGTHYPGCRLTEDNATLHYNYTAPNRSNTTVTIPSPPVITEFTPTSTNPENNPEATRAFSIIIDQTVNVQWTINGSAVSPGADCTSSCTTSAWTNTSASSGVWNITAFVSNANGNDQQTWTWTVYNPPNITSCVPGGAPCPNGTEVRNDGLDSSRTFTANFDQIVNVSWFINGTNITAEHQAQDTDGTDNYINTSPSLQPGTWNITSLIRNANGSDQQTWLWTVYPPPTITPQTPAADPIDPPNATRIFNISTDQRTNATWYINGTILQTNYTNPPVLVHNYTNTSSRPGTWNITVRVNNSNGTTQQVWNWTVNQSLAVTGSTPGAAPADNANATRVFTVNTNQLANATWYINGTPVQFNTTLSSSHTYTNTSAASGVWNITTIVNNSNGTVQQVWNWTVGPDINATSPGAAPDDTEGAVRTFTAYANQVATFAWYLDGTSIQTNTSATSATYTNTSASQGTWNLSLYISNSNGSDQFDWTWTVSAVPNVRLIREMTNGTSTNSIFNITLQVVNPANATANLTGLILNETLPTGWTILDNSTGYNSSPYNITFDLNTLTIDNHTSVTYRVQAPSTGGNSNFSANITFQAGGPSQTVQGLFDPWNVTITANRANFDFELDLNRADTTINRTISNNTNQSAQWTITNIGDVPIPDGETLYLRLQYNKTAWALSSPTCAQCTACEIISIDSVENALQCTAPNTTTSPGNTLTVNFTINSSLTSYDDTFTSNATYDPPFVAPGATTAVTVPAGEPPVVFVPEPTPAPTTEPTPSPAVAASPGRTTPQTGGGPLDGLRDLLNGLLQPLGVRVT